MGKHAKYSEMDLPCDWDSHTLALREVNLRALAIVLSSVR